MGYESFLAVVIFKNDLEKRGMVEAGIMIASGKKSENFMNENHKLDEVIYRKQNTQVEVRNAGFEYFFKDQQPNKHEFFKEIF